MYKLLLKTALVTFFILALQTAQAEAPVKAAVCSACHGANGISTTDIYPNLAGQKKTYLTLSLKAFRSRERPGPVMQGMAVTLTDEEIEELADYYSKLK